jgi:S1-C subfamily serine protease
MRDNESDSEGGWEQPPEYVNPWAPRNQGTPAGGSGSEANAAPPLENGPQDTIAFGNPARPTDRYGQDSHVQPGYGNQPGNGQPGYGSAGSGQPGYGSAGWGEAGFGGAGGQGDNGGFGAPGWGQPGVPPPGRGGHGRRFLIYVAVAALAASIGAGVTVAVDNQSATGQAPGISSRDVPGPHNNASGSGATSSALNRAAVEKKVEPGLVDIISTLRYNSETAEGTGMIVSRSGLVLTNNHVIDQATNVTASLVLNAGRRYQARVVGYDAADDVALLQLVGAANLTPVSFGNSAQVSLGTPVLALGNAEGQGGARPAEGIINALNRRIQASDEGSGSTEDLTNMLQTNALIQQGDSGGALANNAGQVIGMITAANSSTSSQTGQSGGTLGFAIPINSALSIARQIAGGKSSAKVYIGVPGFLGVEVAQSSSPNPQQQAIDEQQTGGGGPVPRGNGAACQNENGQITIPAHIAQAGPGALILGVLCGTTAQLKGIVPGDVITSVNGLAVTTPKSLTDITAKYHPGAVVSVTWVSISGAKHTSSMTLGSGPAH